MERKHAKLRTQNPRSICREMESPITHRRLPRSARRQRRARRRHGSSHLHHADDWLSCRLPKLLPKLLLLIHFPSTTECANSLYQWQMAPSEFAEQCARRRHAIFALHVWMPDAWWCVLSACLWLEDPECSGLQWNEHGAQSTFFFVFPRKFATPLSSESLTAPLNLPWNLPAENPTNVHRSVRF
jgi:hypothetical protein